jgi:hypothetical protein
LSLAIKPSSTPSASVSRPSAGPPPGRATRSRPTGGPGWCWPATPSCAWPASSPRTRGCRGSGPDPSHGCHPIGCGAGFRGCCAHWARRRVRRNPPDAPQAGSGAAARDLPCVTQRSRSQPPSPEEAEQGRESRLRAPPSAPSATDRGRRSTGTPRRVKSQAKGPVPAPDAVLWPGRPAVMALTEIGSGAHLVMGLSPDRWCGP